MEKQNLKHHNYEKNSDHNGCDDDDSHLRHSDAI